MSETIRLDGVDIALTADSVSALIGEHKRQLQEARGRLDALGQELDKEKASRIALEDPSAISSRVSARIKLVSKCSSILGGDERFDSMSDEELKVAVIKKRFPSIDLKDKSSAYIDGVFETISVQEHERSDSLSEARATLSDNAQQGAASKAYEKWLTQSTNLWQQPLTGRL